MSPNELQQLVATAWDETLAKVMSTPSLMGESSRLRNLRRAGVWIDNLALEFSARYSSSNFHVFWRGNNHGNPICGKLKELLFDIAVCELLSTRSLQAQPKSLEFVSSAHWLVESEFAKSNTREIILDMSKLVIGAARNKLFVAAHRPEDTEQKLLDRLSPIAQCCDSPLFLAFVSHPDDWFGESEIEPVVYQWSDSSSGWQLLAPLVAGI